MLNPNLTTEKVLSTELGYGLKYKALRANINLYRTEWKDRWQRVTTTSPLFAEIDGISQEHYGVEFDATYRLNDYLSFEGMFSYGDWKYNGNATGQEFDDNFNPTGNKATLNLNGVKVGDAAQTTASFGATVTPVKNFRINGLWRYNGRLYSRIDATTFRINNTTGAFINPNASKGTLELPSYDLLDANISYKWELPKNTNLTFTLNIYNLLDTFYISDGRTSIHADDVIPTGQVGAGQTYTNANRLWNGVADANQVFFGFGRTWNFGLRFEF